MWFVKLSSVTVIYQILRETNLNSVPIGGALKQDECVRKRHVVVLFFMLESDFQSEITFSHYQAADPQGLLRKGLVSPDFVQATGTRPEPASHT